MAHSIDIDRLKSGDRRTLARAITLVESTRLQDRTAALTLLEALEASSAITERSLRIGISGIPGVGKSTFIEAFGRKVTESGRSLAVLAVDPSSHKSGGSILGDKTRMESLSRDPQAFVRPSPGGTAHGGVAPRTREAILLCQAAGFDVVVVETIGVGQSETAVAEIVDYFLLLALAGAGDDLQGIKRGILEHADGVAITKSDGDNVARTEATAQELRGALGILRASSLPDVRTCSARTDAGISEILRAIDDWSATAVASGAFAERRREQSLSWFEAAIDDWLRLRFLADSSAQDRIAQLRERVAGGSLAATSAMRRLLGG